MITHIPFRPHPMHPPALKGICCITQVHSVKQQSGPSSQTDALIQEILVRTQTQLIPVWDE